MHGDPNGATEKYHDDQGGNLLVFGGTNKLHFYWDVTVVKDDMAKASAQTPTQYAEKLLAGELSFSVDAKTGKLKIS